MVAARPEPAALRVPEPSRIGSGTLRDDDLIRPSFRSGCVGARLRIPPAADQTDRTRGAPYWRATISFLISAIAFAGFRPFGQVLVQFMMVWQRYSRNGSSSASSRSPVYSSRLSAIQR